LYNAAQRVEKLCDWFFTLKTSPFLPPNFPSDAELAYTPHQAQIIADSKQYSWTSLHPRLNHAPIQSVYKKIIIQSYNKRDGKTLAKKGEKNRLNGRKNKRPKIEPNKSNKANQPQMTKKSKAPSQLKSEPKSPTKRPVKESNSKLGNKKK
jgi:hypothetical protein